MNQWGPWQILCTGAAKDWESQDECPVIKCEWHEKDRQVIRNYQEFLNSHHLMEARIACSTAIGALRSTAADPFKVQAWCEDHENSRKHIHYSNPAPAQMWGAQTGWGKGSGGWPGVCDPQWDGVTQVPKTPGKNKWRQQCLRDRLAEAARHEAEWRQVRVREWFLQQCLEDYIDCGIPTPRWFGAR
ncbi:hypothetical protein B0H13DRAFT_2362812 [Mycena leptocephala]|nr:hypothetical protein B0H13DRAFT_2362812 [Mycena leptocephala]